MLSYLVYENTVYWTRSSFFLAANAGLLGFVASKLPSSSRDVHGAQAIILTVACLGGAILSILWHRALKVGETWISRWERVCVTLEPEAFGEIEIWRNRPGGGDSAKRVAHHTAWLFSILWTLALGYVVLVGFLACT